MGKLGPALFLLIPQCVGEHFPDLPTQSKRKYFAVNSTQSTQRTLPQPGREGGLDIWDGFVENPAVTRRTVQILKAKFVACVAVTAWSLAYG